MSGLVAALMDGKPIPVAVVADQQDLKQEAQAEENGEVEINSQMTNLRDKRRMLMEMVAGDED